MLEKYFEFFLSDVDTDEPDEKSILLYISHLYKACPTLPNHPFQQEHDQVCYFRRINSIDFFRFNRFVLKVNYQMNIPILHSNF